MGARIVFYCKDGTSIEKAGSCPDLHHMIRLKYKIELREKKKIVGWKLRWTKDRDFLGYETQGRYH